MYFSKDFNPNFQGCPRDVASEPRADDSTENQHIWASALEMYLKTGKNTLNTVMRYPLPEMLVFIWTFAGVKKSFKDCVYWYFSLTWQCSSQTLDVRIMWGVVNVVILHSPDWNTGWGSQGLLLPLIQHNLLLEGQQELWTFLQTPSQRK